nr:MAG TPA: hypothetical protein [Caudoviricetes sp.]
MKTTIRFLFIQILPPYVCYITCLKSKGNPLLSTVFMFFLHLFLLTLLLFLHSKFSINSNITTLTEFLE